MNELQLPEIKFTRSQLHAIAKKQLEASVTRCICGWFDREYSFEQCPNCGTDFTLLTQWWREMDDRFWGMSKEQLREDFETWRILSAEIVE